MALVASTTSVPRRLLSQSAPVTVSRRVTVCVRAAASKQGDSAAQPKETNVVGRAIIIERLVEEAGLSKVQASKAFETVLGTIEGALVDGKRVTIVGFGSFEPRDRAARNGRNPQTGEALKIPASKVAGFKSSQSLRDKLNGKTAPPKAKAAPAKAVAPATKPAKAAAPAAAKPPAKAPAPAPAPAKKQTPPKAKK